MAFVIEERMDFHEMPVKIKLHFSGLKSTWNKGGFQLN